jgi:hypothetical protein
VDRARAAGDHDHARLRRPGARADHRRRGRRRSRGNARPRPGGDARARRAVRRHADRRPA